MRAKLHGFTLIEILMVIAIIGITLGFALLAFGDFGGGRRAIVAAEQFSAYIKLVQQQAILQTSTLGIKITSNGYGTYYLERGIKWQIMPEKSIFHWQHFPADLLINLSSKASNAQKPDILVDATGNMTEFTLDFGTVKKPALITLVGKHNGALLKQTSAVS